MSDSARTQLAMKGLSAVAAASLFAIAGCAMQPTRSSQAPADYSQPDPPAADSGSSDGTHASHDSDAKEERHHHGMNPYFRTATSTTEGSVSVEGNTIHYHAVAGLLIVHPEGWNDAAGKSD